MTTLQQFIEVNCNLRWILLNYEPLITRVIRDSSKWPSLLCWLDGAKPMWLAAYDISVWLVVLPLRCYHRNPVYIINLQPSCPWFWTMRLYILPVWDKTICAAEGLGRLVYSGRHFIPHVWQVLAAYLNTVVDCDYSIICIVFILYIYTFFKLLYLSMQI